MSDATSNDDLKGLVGLWRDIANAKPMDTERDRTLRTCADSLEIMITDE